MTNSAHCTCGHMVFMHTAEGECARRERDDCWCTGYMRCSCQPPENDVVA